MTGDQESLKIIRMKDLRRFSNLSADKLIGDQVKHNVVVEFLSYLRGLVSKQNLTSNIDDHLVPVQIMSGIYKSHAIHQMDNNPIIRYNLAL